MNASSIKPMPAVVAVILVAVCRLSNSNSAIKLRDHIPGSSKTSPAGEK